MMKEVKLGKNATEEPRKYHLQRWGFDARVLVGIHADTALLARIDYNPDSIRCVSENAASEDDFVQRQWCLLATHFDTTLEAVQVAVRVFDDEFGFGSKYVLLSFDDFGHGCRCLLALQVRLAIQGHGLHESHTILPTRVQQSKVCRGGIIAIQLDNVSNLNVLPFDSLPYQFVWLWRS